MLLGLIGKPNAGKSTFFHAATLKPVEIANYPFTTIEPNVGVTHVRVECPHKEIGKPCQPKHGFCIDGIRFVPVELMDVAGLIPGAHQGKGLGNKFLDDMRRANVLIMVVDASAKTDEQGNPGKGDPLKDIRFVEEEFDIWLFNIIQGILKRRHGNISADELSQKLSGLEIPRWAVEDALTKYNPKEFEFARYLRKISKPLIIAANKADIDSSDEWIKRLKKELEYPVIPTSAAYEVLLRKASESGFIKYVPGSNDFEILKDLNEKQAAALEMAKKFLAKYGSTGVQQVLDTAVFDLGRRIAVFPVENENTWTDGAGNVLPDCFLVEKGTTAREFAYKLHTDIGEGFIRAIDARTKRIIGADYELKHRDVIKIVFKA